MKVDEPNSWIEPLIFDNRHKFDRLYKTTKEAYRKHRAREKARWDQLKISNSSFDASSIQSLCISSTLNLWLADRQNWMITFWNLMFSLVFYLWKFMFVLIYFLAACNNHLFNDSSTATLKIFFFIKLILNFNQNFYCWKIHYFSKIHSFSLSCVVSRILKTIFIKIN